MLSGGDAIQSAPGNRRGGGGVGGEYLGMGCQRSSPMVVLVEEEALARAEQERLTDEEVRRRRQFRRSPA